MSLVEVIMSSTKLDRHNECMSLEALEKMADSVNKHYIPVGIEHDPRVPPQGRVIAAEIIQEPHSGEYLLKGIIEKFDGSEMSTNTDKTIRIDEYNQHSLELHYDRSNKENLDLISEINEIINSQIAPQFCNKKSLAPLSTFTICGKFIVGAIATGFFAKVGSDIWERLKPKLAQLFIKNKAQEKLFTINFEIINSLDRFLVEIILVNPTEQEFEQLYSSINNIDNFIDSFCNIQNLAKVVIEFKDGTFNSKFIVTKDCIPKSF